MVTEVNTRLRASFEARAADLDPQDMARVINGTPGQIEFALTDPDFPTLKYSGIKRVLVAGMGGSALPADVVADIFGTQLHVPFQTTRHYDIQAPLDESTLVIVTSFSGSTEETLSVMDQVSRTRACPVAISAGGALAERAAKQGCPSVRIPKEREPPGFQPRCALGYFATYLTRVLESVGLLDDGRDTLQALVPFLHHLDVRGRAEEAADWLGTRVPIVYTDQKHALSIARITKIKLNENSKRPAFFNAFPEANHNEMIGMAGPYGEYGLFYIDDPASHRRIRERYEVMQSVFRERGLSHVQFDSWQLPGNNQAERVFAGLVFADWWSYSLALLDGVNPTPVELVEAFKQELRKPESS